MTRVKRRIDMRIVRALDAALTFVGSIAVGPASHWLAESAGPISEAAVAALGASLLLSYAAAPVMAAKRLFSSCVHLVADRSPGLNLLHYTYLAKSLWRSLRSSSDFLRDSAAL